MAALGYLFALVLVVGVPMVLLKSRTSRKTLAVQRLPYWSDIGLSIVSILPYYLISGAVLYLGMEVFSVIDPEVGQDIPFKDLSLKIEYIVAFITLVVLAPAAEEVMFRGYFLGKLQEKVAKWLAVVVTAAVFGMMHLVGASDTGSIVLQWGAAADTFAMGLVAGGLRVITGSVWAGALLHSIKNAIAYYFLFINPLPPGGM